MCQPPAGEVAGADVIDSQSGPRLAIPGPRSRESTAEGCRRLFV